MNPLTNFEFGLGLIIYYYAIILDTTNLCQSIIGNHSNQYLVRFSDFPLTLTRSVCCKISWYQTHGLFMEMNDNCYEPRIRQGHRGKENLKCNSHPQNILYIILNEYYLPNSRLIHHGNPGFK